MLCCFCLIMFSKYMFSVWSIPLIVFAYCAFYICRCIRQALKEKITILVTHQWQILEDASQILILKNVSGYWKSVEFLALRHAEDQTSLQVTLLGLKIYAPFFLNFTLLSTQSWCSCLWRWIQRPVEMSLLHSKPHKP